MDIKQQCSHKTTCSFKICGPTHSRWQLWCVRRPDFDARSSAAMSHLAHKASTKWHAKDCCTLHCMSPVDAFLEVIIGIGNLSRAHSAIASMLLALNDNQLTNALLDINDKSEVSYRGLAAVFGIHVHQESHRHPIWNIHNAVGLRDELV